jgi:hypothetical protein
MAKGKVDLRKYNGGKGKVGRKSIPLEQRKQTLIFYVKGKYVEKARDLIQPIIDKLNSKI